MSATKESPQPTSTFITLNTTEARDSAIVDAYVAEPGHNVLFLDAADKHMIANHLAPHLAMVAVSPCSHYGTLFIREASALPAGVKAQLNHLLTLIRDNKSQIKLIISCAPESITEQGLLVVPTWAAAEVEIKPGVGVEHRAGLLREMDCGFF